MGTTATYVDVWPGPWGRKPTFVGWALAGRGSSVACEAVLATAVLVAFVVVVALLARRLRGSPFAPKSCCSTGPWPPDDLHPDLADDPR
jgi:hypothetical protein